MRRFAAVLALVLGSVLVAAGPAHADQTYYGCVADGKYMFGSYPVNHDQDIFTCDWSPYWRTWKYSSTCAAGTHPQATLEETTLKGLWIAQTRCVAGA